MNHLPKISHGVDKDTLLLTAVFGNRLDMPDTLPVVDTPIIEDKVAEENNGETSSAQPNIPIVLLRGILGILALQMEEQEGDL